MSMDSEDRSDAEVEALRRRVADQEQELIELQESVVHWRAQALRNWATRVVESDGKREAELEHELVALRQTLSWRVTAPLRVLRRVAGR